MLREWRRVPPALLLGFAIQVVFGIARVVHFTNVEAFRDEGWNVYENAFSLAAAGLVASGLWELARRLPRTAAIGARIAAIAVLVELSWAVGWLVIGFYGGSNESQLVRVLVPIVNWLPGVTLVATAVGIGIATRRLAWIIALPVAVALVFPVPALDEAITRWLEIRSATTGALLRLGPYPVFALACLVACFVASAAADAPTRERGDVAFERAAKALWLRVSAALGLAGLMLFVIVAEAEAGEAVWLLRVVVVLAPAIDAFALILFARALLGLSRANVSRWFVLPAAGAALWAAAVLVVRAFATASMLYGARVHHYGDANEPDLSEALPVLLPLVAGAAILLVLVAITQLMRERGREELRENATVRTGVFVVLSLGALYIAHHEAEALSHGASKARVVFGLAGAAFASIYALVIAAKLCRQAATVVADDTALPGAKLLSGGPR
jgi:hypothetical protein